MIFNSQSVCGAKFTEKSTFYRVQNSSEAAEVSPLERQHVEKHSNDKSEVACDVYQACTHSIPMVLSS